LLPARRFGSAKLRRWWSFVELIENPSDVDVMVIGDVSFADVSEALAQAQEAIGREVNPSVYTPTDFRAKVTAKRHFLRSVLKGEKIFLIGDERELRRLAKK
jgi:hypothetical protein